MKKEKLIVILGAGESGTGAAILAKKEGFKVFISDFGKIADKYKVEINKLSIEWEEGKHSEQKIMEAFEIIKSPGISDNTDIIQKALKKGINVISEIEFAERYATGKKICITGSNGKTTTAMLLHHIFVNDGKNVALAGNIGKSFARQVAQKKYDFYILELSSFQLDNMYKFRADIAILLNITPDHLDRYQYKFKNYAQSKMRIVQNQTSKDFFIFCDDDPETLKIMEETPIEAQKLSFSTEKTEKQTAYLENNTMTIKTDKHIFTQKVEDLALQGVHNVRNTMAAGVVANLAHIRSQTLRDSFASFKGVEHRLEFVKSVWGVKYINDSKATNINSVWYALQSINDNIVLLLGGKDKGNDYGIIKDMVRKKVKAIICIGVDNTPIHESFADIVQIIDAESIDLAVKAADHITEKGDTVLLSPACASFDRFKNYQDRGLKFKEAVENLG